MDPYVSLCFSFLSLLLISSRIHLQLDLLILSQFGTVTRPMPLFPAM